MGFGYNAKYYNVIKIKEAMVKISTCYYHFFMLLVVATQRQIFTSIENIHFDMTGLMMIVMKMIYFQNCGALRDFSSMGVFHVF